MKGKYCYFNGKIVLLKNAKLPLDDLGVLRGYGVFDFIRTYNKKPFMLDEHLDRFWRSAKYVDLSIPISRTAIRQAIDGLIRKNKFSETNIRTVLTGGPSKDGIHYEKPTFYILADEYDPLPEPFYQKGIVTVTCDYQRELPQAKTNNYIRAVYLRNQKRYKDIAEILYVLGGKILEGTTSNFFLVKKKKLITPQKNILLGITRQAVLRAARWCIKTEKRDIKFSELKEADEAFFTATNKEILPVVRIDDIMIGSGKVGDYTKELQRRFKAYREKD